MCIRDSIGLVQISAHTSHIAHIITHIVSDNSRISRVILRDSGLHLTHQVGAHISRCLLYTS